MRRFKIGQKVVAIKSHRQGFFTKGQVFTIDGNSCCVRCGLPTVYLKEFQEITGLTCTVCGCVNGGCRQQFRESRFAPIQNNADAIEYKLKVSIPELTEIKEPQLQ